MPTILPLGPQVQFIDAAPPPATYDPAVYIVRLGALWLDITNAARPMLYMCYASTPEELRWLRISDLGGEWQSNLFMGRDAGAVMLAGASNGRNNVAVGNSALGVATVADFNAILGNEAAYSVTSGYGNAALGYRALYNLTTGRYNTSLGYQAMLGATTGELNTCIGWLAGAALTSGSRNILIGGNAGGGITTQSDVTIVGYGATINAGVGACVALGTNALARETGSLALGSMILSTTASGVAGYLKVAVNGTPYRIALLNLSSD